MKDTENIMTFKVGVLELFFPMIYHRAVNIQDNKCGCWHSINKQSQGGCIMGGTFYFPTILEEL